MRVFPTSPLVSLRQRLFRRFGFLIAGTMVLFALSYFFFGVRPLINHTAEYHFVAATDRVETSLQHLFAPVEDLVRMATLWAHTPGFDVERPEDFNQLFVPILSEIPQISSVVAGTTDGEGWLLLQRSDNSWLNRMTDLSRWGKQQQFYEWRDQILQRRYGEEVDYDPRRRPWFQGAMQTAEAKTNYWTPPYTFFTTKDPGITVSSRTLLDDGRQMVVGFDIKLLDISLATSARVVGKNGYVLVITSDNRVLGLPHASTPLKAEELRRKVLQPVDTLGLPLRNGIQQWNSAGRPATTILHFSADDRSWVGSFRPFYLGTQTFWVVTLAPAGDFLPPWQDLLYVTLLIAALILGLTLLEAHRQAKKLSTPLEILATDSDSIAHLDFASPPSVPTDLREIQQLGVAHAKMRTMLEDFQRTVVDQESALRNQIADLNSAKIRLQQSESSLRQALNEEEAILDNALVGVLFVRDRKIVKINRRLCELLGYTADEIVGRSTEIIYDSHELFLSMGEKIYAEALPGGNFAEEILAKRKNGTRFWAHLSGQVLDSEDPQGGSVWIVIDLTEQKLAQERLEWLGNYDPLTTLPNRPLFNDRLKHAIVRATREAEQLAILFIDLDHFKAVNDTLGRRAGDRMLAIVAQRLTEVLRASDTLARLGGDEFIILVEDVTSPGEIAKLLRTLLDTFATPTTIGEQDFYLTLSIGISLFPADGTDDETLVRHADAAMSQAKTLGRNTYQFYSEAITSKTLERFELENQLRQAVSRGQLEVHYQPQVNVVEKRVVGAEALVRWNHPERGIIPPSAFIPIAEETGIIVPIGQQVLQCSCEFLKSIIHSGLNLPRMAVNLSAKQLQFKQLLQTVQETLEQTGINADTLEMEITESFFLETEEAFDLLRQLGQLGVSLALDDFGTGYSALSYLKQLPFRKLKIDQSFVRDIGQNADGESLVRTIINLASSLGLEVIAEGVETQQQVDFLLREGCPLMQGYFFAKPMPAAIFRDWLIRQY